MKKSEIIGTLIFLALIAGAYFYFSRDNAKGLNANSLDPITNNENNSNMDNATELKKEILTPGSGLEVKNGDKVTVHYVGTLTNGQKFDSSRDRGEPFQFQVGTGYVIAGWEQGVIGMKVGEVRKLTIPSDLGYGPNGVPGAIPGGATLIFEIELIKIN